MHERPPASDLSEFTPSLTSTNNFINFCLTRNDLVRRAPVRGGFVERRI